METSTKRPIIGITMGDPVGIGPEIIVKALAESWLYDACRPLVLGDVGVMEGTASRLKTGGAIHTVGVPEAGLYQPGTIDVVGISSLDYSQLRYGKSTKRTGLAMVAYIKHGTDWAMESRIQGIATCPINKRSLRAAGVDFDGHTELLAHHTKASQTVMMLAGSRLRVALVTIHVPLALVPEMLTTETILDTIRITEDSLRNSFGINTPKLAVAALNPHAGEDGLFGDEEKQIIAPAVKRAVDAGIDVSGPYPPDTVFYKALDGGWDAIVSMYHDQGLIPFKMVHFSDGVNTTLGLPIIRTSVDHGTAYDIAGKDKADPGSLLAAIRMAADMTATRMTSRG